MRFLNEGGAHEWGVITFKPAFISGTRLQTMIMPAGAAVTIVRALQDHLLIDAADIQLFTLAALERDRPVDRQSRLADRQSRLADRVAEASP